MSKYVIRWICLVLFAALLLGSVGCTPSEQPSEQQSSEPNTEQQKTVPNTDQSTQELTTQEETDVNQPREIGQRYFIYRIWNFAPMTQAQFEATVDTAAASGFNAIKVHIPWSRVEATAAGEYDFSAFDPMIDYVVRTKGMKVAISLDLTRRSDDKVIPLDQMMYDPSGKLCVGGSQDGMRTMISFCSQSAVDAAVAFYTAAVERYEAQYASDILFYLPAFSQYAESEYWCAGEYDYSDLARARFYDFLIDEYKDINALNAVLGTDYTVFGQIELPSTTASDNLGKLWYQFRHQNLKAIIDKLAIAQKEVAPNSKFALQFGSIYDAASSVRCTLAAGDLAEHADVVWIDDGPDTDHEFSMDYADGMFSPHVLLAQEIDGPLQVGATPEKYLEQGNDSFMRGCTYVSIANWHIDDAYRTYEWVWQELAQTWLGDTPLEVIDTTSTERTMEVKLSQLLRKSNPGTFMTQYHSLASQEQYVNIKIIDDLSSNPVNTPESIFSFPGAFSAEQGKGGWYYMCTKPKRTDFIEMTYDAENGRWQGKAPFSLIMKGAVHPDAYDSVLAFEAPRDGVVRYTYSLSVDSEYSDGIKYRVLLGEEPLTHGDKYGYIELPHGQVAVETLEIRVQQGDRICIAVNVGGTSSHDSTALSVEIEYVE
ncbi:MAG: beta-galactosidase [Clostridia bacterium]|nr:beta-galactosidase [Clostridia bacterium]